MKNTILVIVLIVFTGLAVWAAHENRGGFEFGGEWFVWVLPVMLLVRRKEKQK